jgi:hypothetical protein
MGQDKGVRGEAPPTSDGLQYLATGDYGPGVGADGDTEAARKR